MSNKQRAIVLLISVPIDCASLPPASVDHYVAQGNSTLLVMRKREGVSHELDFFSQVSGLSATQTDTASTQSIIEKNFFKKGASKFAELFHNGSFKSVQLFTQSDEISGFAEGYGINVSRETPSSEHFLKNDLTLVHLRCTEGWDGVDALVTKIHQFQEETPTLFYMAISAVPITSKHLTPQHKNPLLASITPPQTYLHVASEYLKFDDVNKAFAVLLIENDKDYMRIDRFQSYEEIQKALAQDQGNPFLYNYQLAESFMKQVAFKLGKMEKFGA